MEKQSAGSVRWRLPARVLFFFFVRYVLFMPFFGLVCGSIYGGALMARNDPEDAGLGGLFGGFLGLKAGLGSGVAIGVLTGIASATCYALWMPSRAIARAGCWIAPAIAACAPLTPMWRSATDLGLQIPFASVYPTLIAVIATWLVSRMVGGQFAERF
jgi:hypothetical protein